MRSKILSSAVYLFDLIRSKLFISSSSVQPHPFKNFRQSCICLTASVQKFSSSVHLFDYIRAKIFFIHASIWPFCFQWLGYPFLIRGCAIRSLSERSFPRNVSCKRSQIDLKFPSSFACFSVSSGYKGMLGLPDTLQIAEVIHRVLFYLFLPCI